MPCRNEIKYIEAAIQSILEQDIEDMEFEFLIADGCSDDGTTEVIEEYSKKDARICLIMNLAKRVPYALKLLLDKSMGEFIVRVDTHCIYPKNYVSTLVNFLKSNNVDNVGGALKTVAGSDTLDAGIIADCLNSRFGVGSSFRTIKGNTPVEVDTVPFGAWKASCFEKYGTFDMSLVRGQDLEYNIRIKKGGGKIVCFPWLKSVYFARDNFKKLYKMALEYGYWHVPVYYKHKIKPTLRQLLPPLFVVSMTTFMLLGSVFLVALLVPLSYFLVSFFVSLYKAKRKSIGIYFYKYMYAFCLLHFGYGFGYLKGIYDVLIKRKIRFDKGTRQNACQKE